MTADALLGVSLKMYMGAEQTREWLRAVRHIVDAAGSPVDVVVLPTFPLIESAAAILSGSGIGWGAQDLAADDTGAQTGEVGAAMLRELGCRYVEVGHAERRRLFGETDAVVAAKTARAFDHDLTPLICVGESVRSMPEDAAQVCIAQLDATLAGDSDHDIVVAYEPVWAIGAARPADPDHVRAVCRALRAHVAARVGATRLLYGGSAGPGTFSDLHPDVDGLFLGRFAHAPEQFAAVLREVSSAPVSAGS